MVALVIGLCTVSCDPSKIDTDRPIGEIEGTGPFVGDAEFLVPAGASSVYIEYLNADGDITLQEVAVTPKVDAAVGGRDVEPFGRVQLQIVSEKKTKVNIFTQSVLPATRSNADEDRVYAMTGVRVSTPTNGNAPAASSTTIYVEEPAGYTTSELGQTFYHSSGVVMFDDSWPGAPSETGSFISDYNDVVVDYDFEARIVSDELLASEGWREQLKVVLHLRAIGGQRPARFGLILENFDQQYVDYIEMFKSLDSYQNPHGDLPPSFERRIGQNCIHDESNPLRPWIEMGGIFRLNQNLSEANVSCEEYTYTNYDENGNKVSHKHVFNPSFGYWPKPDETQFAPGIQIKQRHYYNASPGYVNVNGGLITLTVIYHMKPRAQMNAEQRAKARQNMIDAVMNTTNQNFYIMLMNYCEIGLKGYQPRDSYKKKYDSQVAANEYLSTSNYYTGTDGQVWGIKAPVMTRHLWEKYPFSSAYPKFNAWISGDPSASDWYLDYDSQYLTCWW